MPSNLVTFIENGNCEDLQTPEGQKDNVTHITSVRDYSLNIDRTLRNKINACERAFVEYDCTGGGVPGQMDTATFELFRAACTAFYSRLPPDQGQCEIDKC